MRTTSFPRGERGRFLRIRLVLRAGNFGPFWSTKLEKGLTTRPEQHSGLDEWSFKWAQWQSTRDDPYRACCCDFHFAYPVLRDCSFTGATGSLLHPVAEISLPERGGPTDQLAFCHHFERG